MIAMNIPKYLGTIILTQYVVVFDNFIVLNAQTPNFASQAKFQLWTC
jgi:hypothetical protein